MSFTLSPSSLNILSNVKPAMQDLAKAAAFYSEVPFAVVQGNRTRDYQARLYGKGRTEAQMRVLGLPTVYADPGEKVVTWTMHSNHIGGNAIDVCPIVDGKLEWDNDGKLGLWPKIETAFKTASNHLGIPVYCGADWISRKKDRPHFSLVPG